MKRTTTVLSAFAAGAALLLAGCGSDTAGTAASQAPATSQAASPTSAAPSTEESMSEEPTSEEPTSEEPSSEEPTSEEPSSEEPTSDDSSTADTSATTTVGDGGALDETSVTWFDTYCSGISPALEEVKNLSSTVSGGSSDPEAMMKKLSTTFTSMGKAFTQTAKDLDGVPVPTFDGGDTLASTVTKAMNEFGPKFTELGTELAKGGSDAMSKLQDLGKDVQGLQELSKFEVDAATLASIKEIPSCQPLFSMGG